MQLDELLGDGQAQPQPAGGARRASVRLAKALEQVRQELLAVGKKCFLGFAAHVEFDPCDRIQNVAEQLLRFQAA